MTRGAAKALIAGAFGLAGFACAVPLRDRIEDLVESFNSITSEGVFVSVDTGSDGQPGTRSRPKQSIRSALQMLEELGFAGKVLVAAGHYVLEETLVVPSGVCLSGGYSATDWLQQPELHPSVLEASGADPVVAFAEWATASTVLENFSVIGAWTDSAITVCCHNSSPTIRHNIIDASPGSKDSAGVFNSSASPQIRNNVIYHMGSKNASAAVIQNNTIHIGNRSEDVAIYSYSSRCVIENNILYSEPQEGIGIREADSGALPLQVHCNDAHGCQAVYDARGVLKTTIADMVTYLSASSVPAGGNGSADPEFFDPSFHDYHLAGASPLAGLDLSAAFAWDLEGAVRTVPWSVGVYEKD